MSHTATATDSARRELLEKLKTLLVTGLHLEIAPEDISDTVPIFAEEGLGLDSIDALELVVLLEENFRVAIPDEETGQRAFQSLAVLADYILAHGGVP
jgi:acyl carrier protein